MVNGKILIIDDNALNLKVARVLLESEGYETRTAIDAVGAQRALQDYTPDLILMDIQLPGMDGLEFTRRLKAAPATRGILIVALTSYAMKGDEQVAYDAGCDGYITKPINPDTFAATIAGYLAMRKN